MEQTHQLQQQNNDLAWRLAELEERTKESAGGGVPEILKDAEALRLALEQDRDILQAQVGCTFPH